MSDEKNQQARPTPPERSERSPRNVAIFVASFVVHAGLAGSFHAQASERSSRPVLKQIDVTFSEPPPPPPPPEPEPEEPPPEPEPEPAKVEQPKPRPVARPQKTRATAPKEAQPDQGSALPSSDEGTLPPAEPGTGTPGPEPAPAPPPPPPPPPVIEPKEGANYRNNPRPPYPRLAMREGWEGKVVLRVKVTPDGKVAGATVQRSSGRSVLDEAALDAVKGWTFVPATQGGRPVAGWVSVPFEFQLN